MKPDASPFTWVLAPSRAVRYLALGFFLLTSVLFVVVLPLGIATLLVLLLAMWLLWVWRSHHALGGRSMLIQYANGDLKVTSARKHESREYSSLSLMCCRWLGANTLIGYGKIAGGQSLDIALTPDNSSKAERHRLAMHYHSGAFE